jgi:signal transduction histidine kinase
MAERKRIKVLLVEDDEDDYIITRELLAEVEGVDYNLEWLSTYEAGLDAVLRCGHDVCLVDYRLGARDGVELVATAFKNGCRAPMIVLTGQGDRLIDMRAMEVGAADYIVKGKIDAATLERAIRYALERGRLLGELNRQKDELARSNAELQQFAYVASHDLQEPLRMVSSYLQLIQRRYGGKLGSDADEFIAFAVDGANRMRNLINDLLTYSRVGTRAKDFRATSTEEALRLGLANLKVAIEESGAKVTYDKMPDVVADDSQLVQLFQNLVGNAIKFRGDKAPEVHVVAQPNGRECVFGVRDNGIGIDPKHTERIFQVFQRLHDRTQYPGTGIGLSICKKIVERHGGRIWVESAPGQGATFWFSVPQGEGEPVQTGD